MKQRRFLAVVTIAVALGLHMAICALVDEAADGKTAISRRVGLAGFDALSPPRASRGADSGHPTGKPASDPSCGFIDAAIDSELGRLNLTAAPQSSDAAFVRRVTLDTLGRLPTVEEIRQFVGSSNSGKRAALINRLLTDPEHASLWATRLCDLTGCRLETMEGPEDRKPLRARMWHEWFRRRFAMACRWTRLCAA